MVRDQLPARVVKTRHIVGGMLVLLSCHGRYSASRNDAPFFEYFNAILSE